MSFAAQQAQELQAQINHVMLNSYPDKANDPTSAWADLCAMESEMVTCQKIADEEAQQEAFDGGRFGMGA